MRTSHHLAILHRKTITPPTVNRAFKLNFRFMNLTFKELRDIKHALPTGSISRIASELNVDEQTVRNYFGAKKFVDGDIPDIQVEPGPDGGIVHLEDTRILDLARQMIEAANQQEINPN